jgi:hypothetical protein
MSFERELNKQEYAYLCQALFIQERHRQLLLSAQEVSSKHVIHVSEDQANEIRDLCGEQLQIVGFDESYELTPEGEILEALIDKLFIF